MTRLRHPSALDVRVEIRGELPHEDAEYARAQALETAAALGPGTRLLRIRLTRALHPSVTRPVLAQADVDLDGAGPVRVQLATRAAREAVDLALGTLAGRAARLREQGDIGFAAVHESVYRPQYAARPLAERRIARRKAVVLARRTPEQAARELLALDRRFHLFTDAATGRDGLVRRCPLSGAVEPWPTGADDGRPDGLAEAARRLWLTGAPFVPYAEAEAAAPAGDGGGSGGGVGRTRVLYRRYDGHYGLITPVAQAR
ncbi:sigma 54 modulation/S30EA ribosomal C-terminal domain-containing protein [Kitasatospora sp. NPDC004745]|uniref:sigma 54 modulation/S30EA ribosomal C-terminal domain-containing protein n=1 Tax=Kitasatospora sp. NPDC004745 TaxID=3364019 RepID=UPI0036CB5AE8